MRSSTDLEDVSLSSVPNDSVDQNLWTSWFSSSSDEMFRWFVENEGVPNSLFCLFSGPITAQPNGVSTPIG